MENWKHETGNGKPATVHLLTSVFHFPFPVSGFRLLIFLGVEEKIDTPLVRRGMFEEG
jgi:hypothetical protein